jgi:putative glycosyltransferase
VRGDTLGGMSEVRPLAPEPVVGAQAPPQISVVTTMYRSAPHLAEFHKRVSAVADEQFVRVEFVYVNDGSPDESLSVALELQRHDRRIRIVDLTRNFGHHHAIVAGLEHARGDLVFLVDCDLEEEPEALVKLLDALRANDADVAFGVQITRKGGAIERWGGSLAYRLINSLSGDLQVPRNMLNSRVMTRRYLQCFLEHGESELVFSALAATTGFRQIAVPVRKHSKGTTTYDLGRRMQMFVKMTIAFSDRPLHYIAYLGLAILASSILYVSYLVFAYLFYRSVPVGYTSLAVSIWFLGGLILFSIGIVAIYLSVVFVEVKRRPRYLVRAIYVLPPEDDA